MTIGELMMMDRARTRDEWGRTAAIAVRICAALGVKYKPTQIHPCLTSDGRRRRRQDAAAFYALRNQYENVKG